MVQQIDLAASHVLGFRIEKEISEKEMDQLLSVIRKKLEQKGHFNLYLELSEMPKIKPDAFWEGLKFSFSSLGEYLKQMRKGAVVTEKEWLRKAAEAEDKILPGVDERSFSFSEIDEARNWIKN